MLVALFFRTIDPATKRLPLFASMADKMTAIRRTGQVCGAMVIVGGKVKDMVIGDPIVSDCTGKGCASSLIGCVNEVGAYLSTHPPAILSKSPSSRA
jgi:hypothetical protein